VVASIYHLAKRVENKSTTLLLNSKYFAVVLVTQSVRRRERSSLIEKKINTICWYISG